MTRHSKGRQKPLKPDDYFAWGPFEIARFGKNLIWKSHANAEDIAAAEAIRASHFPTIVAEIDALVLSIATQIARLPPTRLLQRAWWEHAAIVLGFSHAKKSLESDQLAAMRMIDYVQSVITAVTPAQEYAEDVNDEDWNKLKSDVTMLFERLSFEYQLCLTAHRRMQEPSLDMEVEEFRFRAEVLWMNIRGKRYHVHERQALLDVLAPHSDILLKLFGISAVTLVDELDTVLAKLTRGLAYAVTEFENLRTSALARLELIIRDRSVDDPDALMKQVFEDPEIAARARKVMGELFGTDLFDVSKVTVLPRDLLDALSWSPGEDAEFFAPGPFCGWPLRIWPVMKRPFIRVDGRTFCFDIFSLFDNIYRVLRRTVVSRDASYADTWNERQKTVSEALPFAYFDRLVAGARVYRPVYYWVVGRRRTGAMVRSGWHSHLR